MRARAPRANPNCALLAVSQSDGAQALKHLSALTTQAWTSAHKLHAPACVSEHALVRRGRPAPRREQLREPRRGSQLHLEVPSTAYRGPAQGLLSPAHLVQSTREVLADEPAGHLRVATLHARGWCSPNGTARPPPCRSHARTPRARVGRRFATTRACSSPINQR